MNLLNWRDQIYSFRVAKGPIFFFRISVALFLGAAAGTVADAAADAVADADDAVAVVVAATLGAATFLAAAAVAAFTAGTFFVTPPGKCPVK